MLHVNSKNSILRKMLLKMKKLLFFGYLFFKLALLFQAHKINLLVIRVLQLNLLLTIMELRVTDTLI